MSYNSKLYSMHVTILFLAVVALLEQIQCIKVLIIILVSLKTTFLCSNALLIHNKLKKYIGKSGLQMYYTLYGTKTTHCKLLNIVAKIEQFCY
jgi:hypothetical protein